MQGQERCRSGPERTGDAVPGAVTAKVGVALANTRCHVGLQYGPSALLAQLVEHLHGKEGVSGSSPEEGSAKGPEIGPFCFRIDLQVVERGQGMDPFMEPSGPKRRRRGQISRAIGSRQSFA